MYKAMYKGQRRFICFLLLCICISLSAQNFSADRDLYDAYLKEDMSVWKAYVDDVQGTKDNVQGTKDNVQGTRYNVQRTKEEDVHSLIYEYGYCGYIVANDKTAALPYVQQFRRHTESLKDELPTGYYEMYMSAVMVYELRLHVSIHPFKSMSLAKEATRLAPDDPLVLSYYGTCLFYAPKPFGDKREALQWFEKAEALFQAPKWEYCWLKEANSMYIQQCHDKIK